MYLSIRIYGWQKCRKITWILLWWKSNTDNEKEYIQKVVNGVVENLSIIDDNILKNLKNWTINRIAKIDLAILRLAIYEILYLEDIPAKVSVNEAVELAKEYGGTDSKSFVNGLLAKIIEGKVEN